MRTYESFLVLTAELDGDLRELERVSSLNKRAWDRILKGADDPAERFLTAFPVLHASFRERLLSIAEAVR